ncbi:hypothetical protein AVEN_275422-1 [Araneus ventricosus]|uniref:Uncharacterized protein n=1 Tax=Araneus ventricosus TaxID=182803 RepID=A0A4Y2TKT3_ARAVE|nr:hypothetical protein AVEN_193480-1 [Araneus ventricosus]GBO00862.1 hypothetical protein AVEN_275422-1 [Araneus ventricosus]
MQEMLPLPYPAISKRWKITSTEQYSAVLEEVCKKISAENESDALYLDGEGTEYSYEETDSETNVEDNPAHEEYRTQTRTQIFV